MKVQCQINDCDSCYGNGITTRETLKANSSGRTGTSHIPRSSFFKNSIPYLYLRIFKNRLPVLISVAEPAEIPIFRSPEGVMIARDSYRRAAIVPFFNST